MQLICLNSSLTLTYTVLVDFVFSLSSCLFTRTDEEEECMMILDYSTGSSTCLVPAHDVSREDEEFNPPPVITVSALDLVVSTPTLSRSFCKNFQISGSLLGRDTEE